MIEDYVDITVTDNVNTINITPSITDEIVDINVDDNREDVTINVTDSIIEVNINRVTTTLSATWGTITGTLSDQTDLQNALNLKVPTSRTLTINGTTLDLSANRSYSVGTVTSVGLTMPSAFSVANSPITSSGTLAVTGAGDTTQYIAGDGSLITFPTAGQAGTLIREVRNTTGATLTKGTVVYINGANGNKPTVTKALANADSTSAQTFGLIQANIANNANGYVVCFGDITGLDTSAYSDGVQLYLSGTTAGTYTSTKTLAPTHLVYVGVVTRAHPTQGQIEVKIQNGYELDEIHDVAISSVANNQGLFYESSTSLWKNKTIATVLGYTPIGGSGTSNYIAKFNGSTTTLGNSTIFDDGTYVRIGSGGFGKFNVTQTGTSFEVNTSATNVELLAYNRGSSSYQTLSLRGSIFLFSPSDVEKMRLTNAGDLGIGTSAPASLLEILKSQNADTSFRITNTNSGSSARANLTMSGQAANYQISVNNSYIQHYTASSIPYQFWNGGTEKMRLASNGCLGIGTTTPAYTLTVNGNLYASNYISSGGSAGINQTVNFIDLDGYTHDLTFENGLLISYSVN